MTTLPRPRPDEEEEDVKDLAMANDEVVVESGCVAGDAGADRGCCVCTTRLCECAISLSLTSP